MTVSGKYNRRVVIQRPETTRGANGEELISWVSVCARWCAIKPKAAAEALQSNVQVQGTQQYEVRMRRDNLYSDITPKWRLLATDGSALEILAAAVHHADPHEIMLTVQDYG